MKISFVVACILILLPFKSVFAQTIPITANESVSPTSHPYILQGDTNSDCSVDGIDFSTMMNHYSSSTQNGVVDGDFDASGQVDGVDFIIWLSSYGLTCDTLDRIPTPIPAEHELDISVCDPANGPFSATIDNPYNPFPVDQVSVFESPDGERVTVTVLPQIERVAGVDTRVVQEYETVNDELEEISQNFFTQAPDGTVCYYGENVTEYSGGLAIAHDGTWRAGGSNKPGIQMPAHPEVDQSYLQEYAPGIAVDRAHHFAFEDSYTVPLGTFHNVLLVDENPLSTKRYAPGIGVIFDDDAVLVSQTNP